MPSRYGPQTHVQTVSVVDSDTHTHTHTQGAIGDCWFLGALSLIATRDDLLKQIFAYPNLMPEHGIVVTRFSKGNDWHYIISDDRLPRSQCTAHTHSQRQRPIAGQSTLTNCCDAHYCSTAGTLVFASCKDPTESWAPLIEKLYAKLHGTYCSLIGGYVDEGLRDLTGKCVQVGLLPPCPSPNDADPNTILRHRPCD